MSPSSQSAAVERDTAIAILIEASEVAAGNTLDLDALLQELATLVRKVADYQLFAVMLPTDRGELRIRHAIGFGDDLVANLRVPIGEGITGKAAAQHKTIWDGDVTHNRDYLRAVDAVRSEIAVPLVARGRLVAVLDLQSAEPDAFGEHERSLLELIASRFSLAIDVAQLYRAQTRQNSTLQTLTQVAQDFSQILQLDELLGKISSLVRTLIRYDVFAIYLRESDSDVLKHYFGVRLHERVRWSDIKIGTGLIGHAAKLRQPVLVDDTTLDPRYIPSTPGIRSEVAIPLILKGEVLGVLDLESEVVGKFTRTHVHTLSLLAPQIAAAIENARLYEEKARNEERMDQDLSAARVLQRHLLPRGNRRYPGIEVAARNDPASEVSGDLYDFYVSDRSFGILNGDVSGKGAAAALYAALVSGVMRNMATAERTPSDVLHAVNAALLSRKIEARFLAAVYCLWIPDEMRLIVAGAGQPRPIVSRGGQVEVLPLEGIPLGLFPGVVYDEVSLNLEPGDTLVTVSDGFNESSGPDGSEYGDDRVLELINQHQEASAAELLDLMFDDVRAYSAGQPQADDRTAIVVRVTG